MSSLIVLCPHCLTWIETHSECCTECGCTVRVEDPDPAEETIVVQLGEWLLDLGPMKLLRRGWPNVGRLVATTTGLLFVPQFTVHPNGARMAIADEAPTGTTRVANLFHWWSLPPWRRPQPDDGKETPPDAVPISRRPVIAILFDSPGAFFISRDSIRQIITRSGRAQIERRPLRSATLVQSPGGIDPREALKRLIEFAPWRVIISGM